MDPIDAALTASRSAAGELIANAASCGRPWDQPCAHGKWSPSQIVEHVTRFYEASVRVAAGQPSAFPSIPRLLHPVLRIVFRRILRRGVFPKAKTTSAMNPLKGAATLADGRTRLMAVHDQFESECRARGARGAAMATPTFGEVAVDDFIRFIELHTRHHNRQVR